MILSGGKLEEYRDIKDYWARRFLQSASSETIEWQVWEEMIQDLHNPTARHHSVSELLNYFGVCFRRYENIKFRNGYHGNAPEFLIELKGIDIKLGHAEWGAEAGRFYFTLLLGNLIK